jgi:hypothetical protein
VGLLTHWPAAGAPAGFGNCAKMRRPTGGNPPVEKRRKSTGTNVTVEKRGKANCPK